MQETLLLYHIEKTTFDKIKDIADQLHIHLQIIEENQVGETMGCILGMDGFTSNSTQVVAENMEKEFIFFAGMSDQQLDILLQLFKMNQIPMIPYKAMLTEHNVNYTFVQLYNSVKDEYQQITQMQ